MALLPVQLVPPTLADGYCPGSLQEFANDLIGGTTIQSSISTDNIEKGDTAPTDTTKIWFKTIGGLPTDPNQLYAWNPSLALWVKAHLSPAGGPERRLFEGTIGGGSELETYDGGSAGAVGPATGPMWEEATAYRGRSPMAPGAISGSFPAKNLALSEDFGEGAHTQTTLELVAHTHALQIQARDAEGNANPFMVGYDPANLDTTLTTDSTGGGQAFNVTHPVHGVYVIQRTARQFYTG